MSADDFKNKQIQNRYEILQKVINTFKDKAVSIHQFGSVAKDKDDEFSDLDIWITFKDEDIKGVVRNRDRLFALVAPVLIKHENPQNSRVEGKFSLVVYETELGLEEVDYFFSRETKTNILPEAIHLFGVDSLAKGGWILDKTAKENNDPSIILDFLICMSFIGIKMVIRKNVEFLDFLYKRYHGEKSKYFPQMKNLSKDYDMQTLRSLLDELLTNADSKQKYAIEKIKDFATKVEELHL